MDEHEQSGRPHTEDDAMESAATTEQSPATPAFQWGRFFGYLGSIVVVTILVGSATAFWYGRKPLERRAQELAVRITRVEFNWPVLGERAGKSTTGPAVKPSGPDIVDASKTKPGDKKKPTKNAVAIEPLPMPEASSETTWLPEQFQEQLISLAKSSLGEDADPLSREPLDRVASELERTGWFVGKPGVSREPDGVLRVQGVWRLPAAVVRQGATDYLVSWDGFPMPVSYKTDQSKLPVLFGVASGVPAAAGKPSYARAWEGEEIPAALELLRLLTERPWMGQVAGIDVKDLASTKRLAIVTRRGGRVVWGGRASKPLWGEISTPSKLDRLAELHRKFGSIDANIAEGSALEIFWERPLVLNISASNSGPLVEDTQR